MGSLDDSYRDGVETFDRGEYYESHEFFEEAYNEAGREEEAFFRALLELAGAFHILRARNRRAGACEKIARAASRLAPFAPEHRGLDVRALLAALGAWQRALAQPQGADPAPPRLGPGGSLNPRERGAPPPYRP